MDPINVLIIFALLATIIVMMMGLFSMGHGENMDKVLASRLMWARVAIQSIAILLLILAVYLR